MKITVQNLLLVLFFGVVMFPKMAYAQDFKSIANSLSSFLLSLVPFLAVIAVVVFFWGLAQYVFQAGNQAAVEDARQRMLWGIVGLFFISAIWGVVQFIGTSINIL